MSLSAKAMLQVVAAKKDHDAHCPYGMPAKRVHIHPAGIEELGWDEGDVIAGLEVVGDDAVPRRTMRVMCDGDPEPEREPVAVAGREADRVIEDDPLVSDPELVPA